MARSFERNWLPVIVIIAIVITAVNGIMLYSFGAHSINSEAFASWYNEQTLQQAATQGDGAPCGTSLDVRTSNLCAAWRGVDTARAATNLSFWALLTGTVINVFTLVLVVLSFRETRKSSDAAIEALRLSNQVYKAERAWLTAMQPVIECEATIDGAGKVSEVKLTASLAWENTGRSPAHNVRPIWKDKLIPKEEQPPAFPLARTDRLGVCIGAGTKYSRGAVDLKGEDAIKLVEGKLNLVLYSSCYYEDIFDETHESAVCLVLEHRSFDCIPNSTVKVRFTMTPAGSQNYVR